MKSRLLFSRSRESVVEDSKLSKSDIGNNGKEGDKWIQRSYLDVHGNDDEEEDATDVSLEDEYEGFEIVHPNDKIAHVVQAAAKSKKTVEDPHHWDIAGKNKSMHLDEEGSKNVVVGEGTSLSNLADRLSHRQSHRHQLPDKPSSFGYETPVRGLIFVVVILHLLGLFLWLRAWLRQKRSKAPPVRSYSPSPPAKVSASYDMDGYMKRTSSVPRRIAEMASLVKGLDLKGLGGLKPSQA